MYLYLDQALPNGRFLNDRFYSAFLAVAVHGLVFAVGALGLMRGVEYGIDASNGMAEVDLVAAPAAVAEVSSVPPPPPIDPEDVAEPVKTQAPVPPVAPIPAPAPETRPSTGKDATTLQHIGSSGSYFKPGYFRNPPPVYPPEARKLKQQGTTLLELDIAVDGKVKASRLKQTSGFPLLDAAALKGVQGWRFKPATLGGLRVETRVDVPIRFELK